MRYFFEKKSNSALTVVELMVAAAILGVAITMTYTQISQMKRVTAKLRLNREISDLRDGIILSTDCNQTLKTFTSDDGRIVCSGAIPLKDRDGNNLPNPIKNMELRIICSNSGLTVNLRSALNAKDPLTKAPLDYSNTSLNPLFGRASAYGLCDNSFKQARRIRVFSVSKTELPYTVTDCSSIRVQQSDPSPHSVSNPAYQSIMQTALKSFKKAEILGDRCRSYCSASPRFYVGGYLADCSSSEVSCVCFR